MEKKKLTLKKEVVATLSSENLRGGYDVIDDKRTKYPICIIESGLCVPATNQANCFKQTILCPRTEICLAPTIKCESDNGFCLANTMRCFPAE